MRRQTEISKTFEIQYTRFSKSRENAAKVVEVHITLIELIIDILFVLA